MSTPPPSAIALAISLSDALDLVGDEEHPLAARIEEVDVVLVGLPADVADPRHPHADATVLIGALAPRFRRARWFATASFAQDFPYNIARRVASLAVLTGDRVGLALVPAQTPLPLARPASAGETLADGILATRKLWESWPLDSVVADRERRVFVESAQIRLPLHDDVWSVRGPLQVPVNAAEIPPIAVWAEAPVPGADLVLSGADPAHPVRVIGTGAPADPARTRPDGASLRAVLGLEPAERILTDEAPAFVGKARIQ